MKIKLHQLTRPDLTHCIYGYGLLCFKQSNSSCCSSDLVFGISRNNLRASLSHTMRPASSSCNIVNFCTFVSERYENSSCYCYCCSWCLYTMLFKMQKIAQTRDYCNLHHREVVLKRHNFIAPRVDFLMFQVPPYFFTTVISSKSTSS